MSFDEPTHTAVPYPDKAAGLQRQAEAATYTSNTKDGRFYPSRRRGKLRGKRRGHRRGGRCAPAAAARQAPGETVMSHSGSLFPADRYYNSQCPVSQIRGQGPGA